MPHPEEAMPWHQVHATEEAIYHLQAPTQEAALAKVADEETRHTLDRTSLSCNVHGVAKG